MRVAVNGIELFVDGDIDGDVVGDGDINIDGDGAALARGSSHGPDGRPVVLAIHGLGLDHLYLKPPLARLADAARLVYVDLRAQGGSVPAPVESCTLEQMADDLAQLCAALGIRPVLLGHSFGGFVALLLALRHPGRVRGLVLIGSAARIDLDEAFAILESRRGAAARGFAESVLGRGESGEAALIGFAQTVVPAYTHPATAAALADLAHSRMAFDVTAHFFRHHRQGYDLRGRLGEIGLPSAIITGDHDWILPPARARELAAGIPGAALALLPDTGHFALNERPAEVTALVRQFLAASPG